MGFEIVTDASLHFFGEALVDGDMVAFVNRAEDVADILFDRLRCDAMFFIVGHLLFTAPIGLANGPFHRTGHVIGIENDLAVSISSRTTDGLDEGRFRAQEALLVRVENRDKRAFGNIKSFAQQVDADQDIKRPRRRSRMISMRSMVSTSECI